MSREMEWSSEEFDLGNWRTWQTWQLASFWVIAVLGQEVLQQFLVFLGRFAFKRIPETGKPLEKFGPKDWFFVCFNRFSVPLMTYHLLSFVSNNRNHIEWDLEKLSYRNSVGSVVAYFALYDILYVPFHGILHMRGIYKYIHKHHHRNAAPFRGNIDASNTHPVEFLVGEYLHLLVVYIVPGHVLAVAFFLIFGGLLASMNHTRLDLSIPGIFNVRAHDKHHHMPQSNYGQYTMFVDKLIGTFQGKSACKVA
eukprot:CAMPEP_0184545516 /NCGR_PEP_ID=MMETSP0199_2-20130426/4358_1 /TAXON_ID=1112570 /ORGANISM="Thraustochytrium sp., Strain LLF1b" /LENGTH=251 /DNA_ID=CAMNT_0026939821 /DNA_START=148 /DNA_END=903 /DNA_ORIENTATION=-